MWVRLKGTKLTGESAANPEIRLRYPGIRLGWVGTYGLELQLKLCDDLLNEADFLFQRQLFQSLDVFASPVYMTRKSVTRLQES